MSDAENRLAPGTVLYWLLLIFFVAAVGYSFYGSIFPKDEGSKKARVLCIAGVRKSEIIVNFMQQAAEARRAGAAAEANPIAAENDLAAAKRYEADAARYDKLTVKNC